MSTVEIELGLLHAAPQNANVMSEEAYASLMLAMRVYAAKYGGRTLQPVLVRPYGEGEGALGEGRGYEIIDGHHRVRAARESEWAVIDALVVEMTPEEAEVVRLGMNKTRGEPDLGIVSAILTGLRGADVDLALTGYSNEELDALTRSTEHEVEQQLVQDGISADETATPAPSAFTLEVPFDSREDYARARRALKKAAGKGGTLAAGLLRILDAT